LAASGTARAKLSTMAPVTQALSSVAACGALPPPLASAAPPPAAPASRQNAAMPIPRRGTRFRGFL
jgi:hypothetical protein